MVYLGVESCRGRHCSTLIESPSYVGGLEYRLTHPPWLHLGPHTLKSWPSHAGEGHLSMLTTLRV